MIFRCTRCWGSKDLEDMFTCFNCHELFCKTHKALSGLSKCEECFESDFITDPKKLENILDCSEQELENIKYQLHRISNKILYAVPAGYSHIDVLWVLKLLQRIIK